MQARYPAFVLLALLSAMHLWGGGGGNSAPPPPVAQSYTVPVTATSGTLQHSTNFAVTVQ